MKSTISVVVTPAFVLAAVLLSGCGGGGMSVGDLWPFGGGSGELSRIPANSTAYQCDGGKRFYLRSLDNGAAAWVILPEREFRLDKLPGEQGTRYGSGKAVLNVGEGAVSLSDGAALNFTGCRIPSAEPAPKPEAKPAAKP